MNYTVSGLDNQLKNESLVPELPTFTKLPKLLSGYPNWVCWVYKELQTGKVGRLPVSEASTLAEAYRRCMAEELGLGFELTSDDPFSVVTIDGYDVDNPSEYKDLIDLASTYAIIDKHESKLHMVGYTKNTHNGANGHVAICSDHYMVPIFDSKLGPFIDPQDREDQFDLIARRYCPVNWMKKLEENRESCDEFTALSKVLMECLDTPGWLEDADTTELYSFLGLCWHSPELRQKANLRMQSEKRSFRIIDDLDKIARSRMPKPERKTKDTIVGDTTISPNDLASMLHYDAKGVKVLENFYNMVLILEHHNEWKDRIRFDDFRNLPMLGDTPVNDTTEYRISEWLGKNYEFGGNKRQILSDAIKAVASKNGYDALLEWIDSLPDWDGTERIDTWMIDLCGSDECDYSRWVSRVTILQMMNRALNPGCIARLVPIWNGLENQGKSTAVALLGGEWATTLKVSLENKEAHMAIHGYWIAELEELDTLYKTSEARLKAFLTNTSDHYVPKYANHSVDYPRRTVFIGTTNDADYLRGLTGNTRFLPINTGEFNLEGIKTTREQLFAEAKEWLLDNPGEAWWQEPEGLHEVIKEQRDSRRVLNVYEEDLKAFLDGEAGPNCFTPITLEDMAGTDTERLEKTTMSDIFQLYIKADSKEKWKDASLQRQIIDALKALGWYRKKANSKNWWMRPDQPDDDEVPF